MAAHKNKNMNSIFPNEYRVSVISEREMVCGKCGPIIHSIFEVNTLNSTDSDNIALCAQCSRCEDVRPTNTVGNELLYELKIIPTSEYLSWADNAN
jgi:flavoprotein